MSDFAKELLHVNIEEMHSEAPDEKKIQCGKTRKDGDQRNRRNDLDGFGAALVESPSADDFTQSHLTQRPKDAQA